MQSLTQKARALVELSSTRALAFCVSLVDLLLALT